MKIIKIMGHGNSSKPRVEIKNGITHVFVSAPPVNGQANKAIQALLAKQLGLKLNQINLKSGFNSRNKIFEIYD